ncbi:MAG TPA: DUF4402 domain-containing protein [Bacteroidales bacterium]|nr:DUF4402 domain-containing protein [Bacteroidales bacterium]
MKSGSYILSIRIIALAGILIISSLAKLMAQEDPPVPITITPVVTSVAFGTLYDPGNDGGSVTINPQTGIRTQSGLIAIGGSFTRGEYEISGTPGTLIVLSYTADIVLNRSGGGGTIDMHIEIYPSPFFVVEAPPVVNKIYIGGTLTLNAGVSAGTYSSEDFTVTLNQP